jgi:hypothetical protein
MKLNLMLRDTEWIYTIHLPHQQRTQFLMMGHWNALALSYWEILSRHLG